MAFNFFKKNEKKAVKHSKPKPKPVKKVKIVKKVVKRPVHKPISKPVIKKAEPIKEVTVKGKYSKEKAFEMLKKSNVPIIPYLFAKKDKTVEDNIDKVGYPALMTGFDRKIIVNNKEEAIKEFKKLIRLKSVDEVLIRKNIESQIEMILVVSHNPSFGKIVSVSMGGKYKEIMKDVKFRICPVDMNDTQAMVKELQGFYLLENSINLESFYNLIMKVASFAVKNEIDSIKIEKIVFDQKNSYIFDAEFL